MPAYDKQELRAFITTGLATALVASIPMVFAIGIGGALVSAVSGAIVSAIVGTVRKRIAQNARAALESHTQLEGVLDSSQLDETAVEPEDVVPFARHGKIMAVVISLVASIVTGGIVNAVTGGTGINFYLGGSSTSTQATAPVKDGEQANAQDSSSQTQAESDDGVTTTWYPTSSEDESTQSTRSSEPTQEAEAPVQEAPTQDTGTENGSAEQTSSSTDTPAQNDTTVPDEATSQGSQDQAAEE